MPNYGDVSSNYIDNIFDLANHFQGSIKEIIVSDGMFYHICNALEPHYFNNDGYRKDFVPLNTPYGLILIKRETKISDQATFDKYIESIDEKLP